MSTLSLPGNVIFAFACALGLAAALSMPWYGDAPASAADAATIEGFFTSLQHVFTSESTTGAEALGSAGTALMGLAVLIAGAALLCLCRPFEDVARPLVTLASVGALGLCVVKLFDQPGANTAVDLRYGIFVAIASAGLALCAAGAISAQQSLRKPPARMVDVRTAR